MSLCRLHLLLVFVFVNNPLLDRTYELNYSVSIFLWQVVELDSCVISLAVLAISVPHDCLNLITSTSIV